MDLFGGRRPADGRGPPPADVIRRTSGRHPDDIRRTSAAAAAADDWAKKRDQTLAGRILPTLGACLAFTGLELVLKCGPCKRWMAGVFRRQRLRHGGPEPGPEELDRLTVRTTVKLVNEAHNFLLVPLSLLALRQPEIRNNKMYGTTRLTEAINVVAAGFFVQDLVQAVRCFKSVGPAMLLHAGICCPVYTFACQSGLAHYYSCGFMLWELSTPLVHAREVMHQMGMAKTKAYKANGLAMIAVFFLTRNVWGSFFLLDFWKKSGQDIRGANRDPRPPGVKLSKATAWTFRGGGTLMAGLNAFWFYKMMRGAIKVFIVKKKVA